MKNDIEVRIRPLEEKDALTSYKWRNDKDVFALTIPAYKDFTVSYETELEWIRRVIKNSDEYRCAIEADGIYVGNIYLTNITKDDAVYNIFIGDKSYWGKGVAFKASKLILQYAFDTLRLKRVVLEVRKEHASAIALYNKLGFEEIKRDEYIEMQIENGQKNKMEKPLVSIICLTYNQEKYVRDCLDGFVMQQTNFPYEVLIYDDASTDGTPAIIREYAAKYPESFRPTLYEKNNYSQGLGFVGYYEGMREAKGKYIAYCEGDDYWTDPLKLQKQVDFLETHPDYETCAHEVIVKYADGKELAFSDFEHNLLISVKKSDYTFDDMLTGNIIHVSSMMYRNFDMQFPSWLPQISAGDMVVYRLLGERGKLHVLPDAMSVYRDHRDSFTNSNTEYDSSIKYYTQLSIPVLEKLNIYWDGRYQDKIYPIIAQYYAECAWLYTKKSMRSFRMCRQMMNEAKRYNKHAACKYFIKKIMNRLFRR